MDSQDLQNMLQRTKQIENLTKCLKECQQYFVREEAHFIEIDGIYKELKKLIEEIINFQKGFKDEQNNQFCDIISKVNTDLEVIKEFIEQLNQRLNNFEYKIQDLNISDSDQFFLSKETLRFRNGLNTIESSSDIFKDSVQEIEKKVQEIILGDMIVDIQDLQTLNQIQKQVTKLKDNDLEKVNKNLDSLDSYIIKSLKNQLNEDNKKSQGLISNIKKIYEQFQKKYDMTIKKHCECTEIIQALENLFDNEDQERMNEIEQLKDILKEEAEIIGLKTNGDIFNADEDNKNEVQNISTGEENIQKQIFNNISVQKQKKNIITDINALVNLFNENNKIIKDYSNKGIKTEKSFSDLIEKNKQIQEIYEKISENINDSKQVCDEIYDRLDKNINNDIISELSKKFLSKYNLLNESEKYRLKAQQKLDNLQETSDKYLEILLDVINKIDQFSPLNNTITSQNGNIDFIDEISQKIQLGNDLKDYLESFKEKLMDYQQPIQECKEQTEDIKDINIDNNEIKKQFENIQSILKDLENNELELQPKIIEINKLQKSVKEFSDREFEKRINLNETFINDLDDHVKQCEEQFIQDQKKNQTYKDLLQKSFVTIQDSTFQEKLEELKLEQLKIEKELKDTDQKLKDLKKKKIDSKKILEELIKNNQIFTPNQIDILHINLEEQIEKSKLLNVKLQNTNQLIEQKIQQLETFNMNSESKKELSNQINEIETEIDEDLQNLKELLDKLPEIVKQIKVTSMEMKEGTTKDGDYVEKIEDIDAQIDELNEIQKVLLNFEESFKFFKEQKNKIKGKSNKAQTYENLQQVFEQLNNHKNAVSTLFTDVLDTQEQLQQIKLDIGDCDIPTICAKRNKEFQQFSVKLDRILKELQNLKVANRKKDVGIETNMKELDFKLKILEKEKQEYAKGQLKELEVIPQIDFEDFSKNYEIIRKLRKFKIKLGESESKLKSIEEVQNDVVKKLTEQDLENSAELLGLKAKELQERLIESKNHLKKITKSGQEMDGNTSNNEEEEFIEALKNEMPEVQNNLETTLKLLTEIDAIVKEVKQTLSISKMNDLKEKVNIIQKSVEESESLVNKLEKEILEWNAQKKLCRRDQELEQIQNYCNEYIEELVQEKQNTEIELEKNKEKQLENKNQKMVDKDGNPVDIMKDLIKLEGQMNSYLEEIDQLLDDYRQLETLKDKYFDDFNSEIPKIVVDIRKKRLAENAAHSKQPIKALKRPAMIKTKNLNGRLPSDVNDNDEKLDNYQMISTNCKHKKTNKKLSHDIIEINNRRKDLEEKYKNMRQEVFNIKQIKLYKPVVGDVVDEMFAGYLNKAKLTIEVQRISASNYLFGTKRILAKIINGRLVIRVGGGYMNAEQFIDQYGKIEMMKMMKIEETKNDVGFKENSSQDKENDIKLKSTIRASQILLQNDIKDKMRQTIQKTIQPYNLKTGENDKQMGQTLKRDSFKHFQINQKTSIDVSNELNQALDNLKNNYKSQGYYQKDNKEQIQSPDIIQKKVNIQHKFDQNTPNRIQGKSPIVQLQSQINQSVQNSGGGLQNSQSTSKLQSKILSQIKNTKRESMHSSQQVSANSPKNGLQQNKESFFQKQAK